ncbi:glycoside hydrolase family 28 protein [Polaribacter staleyi]|uniref:glycoside hydrolase family 28 protein n=1 Tax=Polaribacter staleyi TaxID=2022337 RepID=UPI0031BBBC85
MKKSIVIILLLCSIVSFAQKKKKHLFDSTYYTEVNDKARNKSKIYNILDFGAVDAGRGKKSDDSKLSTKGIQNAIDKCSADGGGTVLVPPGRFVIGTIVLKDNVTLYVDEMSALEGSDNIKDYKKLPESLEEPHFSECLIYADGAENVAIIGGGRNAFINGRGFNFSYKWRRPKIIRIENCKNVTVHSIIIKNSGSWCTTFSGCENVSLKYVSIYNYANGNNDGVDFDGCYNVEVDSCNFQTIDDSICLKSTSGRICEKVRVTNCVVSSMAGAAFKLGTSSAVGFKDIKISNSQFFGNKDGAIKLMIVDGGIMEDVEISHIQMYQCTGPIFIRLGNRGRFYDKSIPQTYTDKSKPEGAPVGSIKNIYIHDIKAEMNSLERDQDAVMITGIPGHYIENIRLENIDLSFAGVDNMTAFLDKEVPEAEAVYPEQHFFNELPSSAFFLRHIKGLFMKNVNVTFRGNDARPPFYFNDVKNMTFKNVTTDMNKELERSFKSFNSDKIGKKAIKVNKN